MLDERTGTLLLLINERCENGSFKILAENELLECFSNTGTDSDSLKAMVNYLEERKYIEVGYAEEGEYCLRPLPEGRLYFEQSKRDSRERFRRRLDAFLLSVCGGFLGGFLGALIAYFVAG